MRALTHALAATEATPLAATETSPGTRVLVGAVLTCAALVLLATAWMSWQGRIRRNRFVGIRTRRTLTSDAAWYAANRAAAPALFVSGVLLLLGSVLGAVLPGETTRTVVQICGVAACVLLALLGLVVGQRAAGEALREK